MSISRRSDGWLWTNNTSVVSKRNLTAWQVYTGTHRRSSVDSAKLYGFLQIQMSSTRYRVLDLRQSLERHDSCTCSFRSFIRLFLTTTNDEHTLSCTWPTTIIGKIWLLCVLPCRLFQFLLLVLFRTFYMAHLYFPVRRLSRRAHLNASFTTLFIGLKTKQIRPPPG